MIYKYVEIYYTKLIQEYNYFPKFHSMKINNIKLIKMNKVRNYIINVNSKMS